MAKAKAAEAIDLTGWATDGPGNLERAAPQDAAGAAAPPEATAAPSQKPKPKAPTKRRAGSPRAQAKPASPRPDRSGEGVDLGAFRRRRRAAAQLNHRVAPELKEALDRTAAALGVPAVELLEALLAELDPDSQPGLAAARERVLAHLMAGLPGPSA